MLDHKQRQRLARIIFDTDTPAGRLYDICLIAVIILSVVLTMLDSVITPEGDYNPKLLWAERGLTALFTLDYIIRLVCAPKRLRYARSFFGIVDLLSVLPTYLSLVLPGSRYLATIRFLRVLRIFRVLNLTTYQRELQALGQALTLSIRRIMAFVLFVVIIVVILGALMYTIEHERAPGFDSIPHSIYWAVVTLTTVGYGDISPASAPGRVVAALIMILGYSIIVIPTGIVAAAVPRTGSRKTSPCKQCQHPTHESDASFCKRCGHPLPA